LAALVTVLIWTSFIVIARASTDPARGALLLPLDMGMARICGAFAVLAPWGWWLTRRDRAAGVVDGYSFGGLSPLPFRMTVLTGFFGGALYACFAYSGFAFAPAAHGSVLLPGGLPLWTSLLAVMVLQPLLPSLVGLEEGGLPMIGAALLRLAVAATLLLLVVAAIDAGFTWWRREQQLMMSREEMKRESRENEGAPELKAAVRRAQMIAAQGRMKKGLTTASVVVVNPTHFAVALRYVRGSDAAPVIVAKGENRQALRIKELGAQHGVPIVENRPVARLLYATGKVGEPIPQDMFETVAEILAFVYRTYRYYYFTLPSRRAAALSN
jgi:type III secretion system FlhB-like substrate exporter